MPVKKFIRDYLHFSRKERLAILSLLLLICFIYFLPDLIRKDGDFPLESGNMLAKVIDSLERKDDKPEAKERESGEFNRYQSRDNSGKELFAFDPNQLSAEGWSKLGLREKTIKTILNYRNKGGKFNKSEDLKKIWGLPVGFYERVKEYVMIETKVETELTLSNKSSLKKNEINRTPTLININHADTSALIALRGIGSKLALRIISFRDKLGGFYSVDQVKETFGLPDSTFQNIKAFLQISGEVKKIHINSATKDELKTHPYIKWNFANAIVEYRNQHGSFKNLDDLKNISLIDNVTFNKIVHYLSL